MIGYEKGVLKLRGLISKRTNLLLQIAGFALFFLIWFGLTAGSQPLIRSYILPSPGACLSAFLELLYENNLVKNLMYSIGLNLAGYIEAILLGVFFGFLIGLFPLFRGLFQRGVDALRFVPLTAVTVIFMMWFGMGVEMKVHFLAFGIFIYLLPVVVQRVDDVLSVYLKTVYTLGATNWQIIKTVFIPHVMSKLIDDIRVLTAISWTYIIIVEMLGSSGGIGALLWRVGQRQGRIDKSFAIVILIIIIGVLQDKIFNALDRHFFPHKYQSASNEEKPRSAAAAVISYFIKTVLYLLLAGLIILVFNEYTALMTNQPVLDYYFGDTTPVIVFLIVALVGYQLWYFYKKHKKA